MHRHKKVMSSLLKEDIGVTGMVEERRSQIHGFPNPLLCNLISELAIGNPPSQHGDAVSVAAHLKDVVIKNGPQILMARQTTVSQQNALKSVNQLSGCLHGIEEVATISSGWSIELCVICFTVYVASL